MNHNYQQQALAFNQNMLRQMFRGDQNSISNLGRIFSGFIANSVSSLYHMVKNNLPKPHTKIQETQKYDRESQEIEAPTFKIKRYSWKDYAFGEPQLTSQNELRLSISQQHQERNVFNEKGGKDQHEKQSQHRQLSNSFSDQFDLRRKKIKTDSSVINSEKELNETTRKLSQAERKQLQKLQFQSFFILQNQARKLKESPINKTAQEKNIQTQRNYHKYVSQLTGKSVVKEDGETFDIGSVKRQRVNRGDRRPLRKKIHLEDEPQPLYDIGKVMNCLEQETMRREEIKRIELQNQEKRKVAEQLVMQRKERERLEAIAHQQQRRRFIQEQEKRQAERLKLELQTQLKEQQQKQKQQEQVSNNSEPAGEKSPKQNRGSQQNNIETPKKVIPATFNVPEGEQQKEKILANSERQKQSISQNKQQSITDKAANPTFVSPQKQQTTKINPFLKNSPISGINLSHLIQSSTPSAFPIGPTLPLPNNPTISSLSNQNPVTNIFTVPRPQIFQDKKDNNSIFTNNNSLPNTTLQNNTQLNNNNSVPLFSNSFPVQSPNNFNSTIRSSSSSGKEQPFNNQNQGLGSFIQSQINNNSSFFPSPQIISPTQGLMQNNLGNSLGPVQNQIPSFSQMSNYSNNDAAKFFQNPNPFIPANPNGNNSLFGGSQPASSYSSKAQNTKKGNKAIRVS